MKDIVLVKTDNYIQRVDITSHKDGVFAGISNSKHTLRCYKHDVANFFGVEKITDVSLETALSITYPDIAAYKDKLENEGKKNSTISRKLVSLRQYFARIVKIKEMQGIKIVNPADRMLVKPPTVLNNIRSGYITPEEFNKILDTINDTNLVGARDIAVFICLYSLGMRRDEVCNLTFDQLKEENGVKYFDFAGKGGKERILSLDNEVKDIILKYIKLSKLTDGKIFRSITKHGTLQDDIATDAILKIVKYYTELSGIGKNVYPHLLRRCFCTELMLRKVPIDIIQYKMGHSKMDTTLRYREHVNALINDASGIMGGLLSRGKRKK